MSNNATRRFSLLKYLFKIIGYVGDAIGVITIFNYNLRTIDKPSRKGSTTQDTR